jgi:hypothetical protein
MIDPKNPMPARRDQDADRCDVQSPGHKNLARPKFKKRNHLPKRPSTITMNVMIKVYQLPLTRTSPPSQWSTRC